MRQRRALILYATMTGNTEKVANWFRETFAYYNWDVRMVRLSPKTDWTALEGKVYFDDYDVICLGSPIVAGAPLKPVSDAMGLNGDGNLLQEIDRTMAGEGNDPDAGKTTSVGRWRRKSAPYPGIYCKNSVRPRGIVFCTYGGGFYGASECEATLAMLELYLQLQDVDLIGRFACGGKETGPAGGPVGQKPRQWFVPGPKQSEVPPADVPDAVEYQSADGKTWRGSYFAHYNCDEKPGPKEESRARIFISDIVEDYFLTYDGEPFIARSKVISVS